MLSRLDFTQHALKVRYRAVRTPQSVVMHADGPGSLEFASAFVLRLIDIVNAGGVGGIEHHPTEGNAKLDAESIDGGVGKWSFQLGGVSPFFLRMVVEQMRMAAGAQDIQGLSIVGELELDDGPLSVDTHLIRTWLDDPQAYPRTWRHNEFPIALLPKDEVMIRLRCESLIADSLRDELERIFSLWLNAVAHIIGDDNREVDLARYDTFPTIGRAKHEMRALFPRFPHSLGPAFAVLCNMLLRFHHQHAQLTELELGAPW